MSERRVSTADVRPIEEVVKDLRKLLVAKLPTQDPDRFVAWSILGECQQHLLNDHERRDTSTDPASRSFRMKRAGEHYVAASIIRKIADAYGVSNFRKGSPDVV